MHLLGLSEHQSFSLWSLFAFVLVDGNNRNKNRVVEGMISKGILIDMCVRGGGAFFFRIRYMYMNSTAVICLKSIETCKSIGCTLVRSEKCTPVPSLGFGSVHIDDDHPSISIYREVRHNSSPICCLNPSMIRASKNPPRSRASSLPRFLSCTDDGFRAFLFACFSAMTCSYDSCSFWKKNKKLKNKSEQGISIRGK